MRMNPDADDRLRSEELGLLLSAEGIMLRLLDGTRLAVSTRRNASKRRCGMPNRRQHAARERQHADTLADEVERLKALLEQTARRREPWARGKKGTAFFPGVPGPGNGDGKSRLQRPIPPAAPSPPRLLIEVFRRIASK